MARIFQTLAQPTEYCYEEKKSRFIAQVWPICNKESGFKYFDQAKSAFPDARHHCWAYLLGDPEQALSAGFNDDGEPGGTAGKPMLNVLTQRKVGNVFAIVIRYFGGIKLGAGGLTRAYGQAVSGALDCAQYCQVIPTKAIWITLDYALEDRLRGILNQLGPVDIDVYYSDKVTLACQYPEHQIEELRQVVQNQSAGKAQLSLQKPFA